MCQQGGEASTTIIAHGLISIVTPTRANTQDVKDLGSMMDAAAECTVDDLFSSAQGVYHDAWVLDCT
jgi:hypothetical protein